MISRALVSFFVIVVFSTAQNATVSAADPGSVAERIFAHFDKDNDGRIESAEFAKLPAPMRVWLRGRGVRENADLPKADFLRFAPQMMADLRAGKPIPGKQPTGEPFASSGKSASPANGGSSAFPLYTSGMPPEEVDTGGSSPRLPAEYSEADGDRDGQINFAEWRKSKPGQTAKFRELDKNGDFVLSPEELGVNESTAASDNRDSGSEARGPVEIVAYDKLTDEQKKKYSEIVMVYFNYMDMNKDGKMQPAEWGASARIKPIFEKGKVDISKDMSAEEFVAHYAKLVGTDDKNWKKHLQDNPPPRTEAKTDSKSGAKSDGSVSKTATSAGGISREYEDKIKSYFSYMDTNKNKLMDPGEWAVSSRIKPAFEKAKVDISKPMDEKTFIEQYVKVFGKQGGTKVDRRDRSKRDRSNRKSRDDRSRTSSGPAPGGNRIQRIGIPQQGGIRLRRSGGAQNGLRPRR